MVGFRCFRVARSKAGGMSAIQDELPIEEPEVPEAEAKRTEADVIAALERRYNVTVGNGRRYATAYGVRSHAGFDARRTADFVVMDLWPSGGLRLHGHEVKVSRSDWLRELKDPSKAAEFIPYMNCWWLAVSDKRIVRPGELPDDWGLLALRGEHMTVVKPAPKRDAKPLPASRLAALLRAVAQTAEYRGRRETEAPELRQKLYVTNQRLERAKSEASEWKAAFAAAGGSLPCRHCGEQIVPYSLRAGHFSIWRHRDGGHDVACEAIRSQTSRWADVEPADVLEDLEES